jgi:hypothetical protein
MLIGRGTLGGGSKWLKDLVDDGSEERSNKWTICIKESLKLIEIVTPLILSHLHVLRLCFLLTIYVRPNRLYRLPDSLWTLPLSRYLAALVSMRLTMLTFLFRIRFSHSRCLCLLSSLLDTYTHESSLQILTQTRLLLTKYYTKLLSAHYQVTDASPYCIMN